MLTVVSRGSFFKGLDNKIIGFVHIFNSSDDRFLSILKSTYVYIQDLDLPNKKNSSPTCRPEQKIFKKR